MEGAVSRDVMEWYEPNRDSLSVEAERSWGGGGTVALTTLDPIPRGTRLTCDVYVEAEDLDAAISGFITPWSKLFWAARSTDRGADARGIPFHRATHVAQDPCVHPRPGYGDRRRFASATIDGAARTTTTASTNPASSSIRRSSGGRKRTY